jgi:hypothetical protein
MSARIGEFIRENLIGLLALYVALGGVALAAALPENSVRSKQIKDAQVKTRDLRGGAVSAAKLGGSAVSGGPGGVIADDTIGGADVLESALGMVPSAQRADDSGQLGGLPSSRYAVAQPGATAEVHTDGTALLDDSAAPVDFLSIPGVGKIVADCQSGPGRLELSFVNTSSASVFAASDWGNVKSVFAPSTGDALAPAIDGTAEQVDLAFTRSASGTEFQTMWGFTAAEVSDQCAAVGTAIEHSAPDNGN